MKSLISLILSPFIFQDSFLFFHSVFAFNLTHKVVNNGVRICHFARGDGELNVWLSLHLESSWATASEIGSVDCAMKISWHTLRLLKSWITCSLWWFLTLFLSRVGSCLTGRLGWTHSQLLRNLSLKHVHTLMKLLYMPIKPLFHRLKVLYQTNWNCLSVLRRILISDTQKWLSMIRAVVIDHSGFLPQVVVIQLVVVDLRQALRGKGQSGRLSHLIWNLLLRRTVRHYYFFIGLSLYIPMQATLGVRLNIRIA